MKMRISETVLRIFKQKIEVEMDQFYCEGGRDEQ